MSTDKKDSSRRGFFRRMLSDTDDAQQNLSSSEGPAEFFLRTLTGDAPPVDLDSWRLEIGGMVGRPAIFTIHDLLAQPQSQTVRTIACGENPAGGGYIATARWHGVELLPLLQAAGPSSVARYAHLTGTDGYVVSLPVNYVLNSDLFLALQMNGAPLSVDHGFPARLLVPGVVGACMPKSIRRIAFSTDAQPPQARHRCGDGTITVKPMVTIQKLPEAIINSPAQFTGFAFAGDRNIDQVTVRFDGGPWMPAQLMTPVSPLSWTPWLLKYTFAAPGSYQLEVRAMAGDSPRDVSVASPALHHVVVTVVESPE